MRLNVRVRGTLADFVAARVGASGAYESVGEYVRDLIRRDKEHAEDEAFDRLKAELALGFAAPESTYRALSADEVIARNVRSEFGRG
jgi:antitoxin ParD1/3/4